MNRKLALPLTALAVVAVASATVVAGSSDTMPATGAAMSTRAAAAPAAAAADAGVSPAVLAYVDAVNAADLDALVGAFTADAVITDVSRPISGSDAIRSGPTGRSSAARCRCSRSSRTARTARSCSSTGRPAARAAGRRTTTSPSPAAG